MAYHKNETSELAATTYGITEWEQAWTDYIEALHFWESNLSGSEFVFWCGVAKRQLEQAISRLRHLDCEFCQKIGI